MADGRRQAGVIRVTPPNGVVWTPALDGRSSPAGLGSDALGGP